MGNSGGPLRASRFLQWERRMEFSSELHRGYPYALVPSPARARIAENLREVLKPIALERFPDLYVGSRRTMPERNSLYYPDITLVQGPVVFRDKEQDVVTNPMVVIHITSRIRESFDRKERVDAYSNTESLLEIVLIWEEQTMVETYRRQPGGSWFQSVTTSRKAKLRIRAVDVEILLPNLYEGVA